MKTRLRLKDSKDLKPVSKKLSSEHIAFLVSKETLVSQAGLSMAERLIRFHRAFPGKRTTLYYLRRTYQLHGIKKKKIRRTKIISPQHRLKIHKEALQAKSELQAYQEEGYHVVYVDEFCTTKSTMPTYDWSPPNATFEIDYKLYHKKTIASCSAISVKGPELIMSWPKSVNSTKYCEFLKALRAKHPGRKLLVFTD